MLSKKMLDMLNKQITVEFYSSNLYLQMSSWCEAQGFEGSASFLAKHSIEEREHMMRLFRYINETGAQALIDRLDKPPHEFKDIKDVFEQTYEHEKWVTLSINKLADAALSEKDFSTFNFLQWYVGEQHEEEKLFKSILDQIDIIGLEGRGLYFLDKKIGELEN
ncbi:MAG: ferritin [Acidobacteria bacterium]|nr:MAG: ferritin [Acidobacteriota bacterium]